MLQMFFFFFFFFFFYNSEYLCSIDIPRQCSAKISCGFGEKVDFVMFAISSNGGLDNRSDPILRFEDPGVRSCSM